MTPHQQTWWPLHHAGLSQTTSTPLDSISKFAQLLGLILERWTLIENELSRCLAALLDGNREAADAIIYSLNSTSIRIAMVRAVARRLMPDGPEKIGFVYLLDRVNDLQKQRNEYIHGEYWHHDFESDDSLDLINFRPMNASPITQRRITPKHLSDHLALCEERELQLSLARAEHPEHNVPQKSSIRSRALSLYSFQRVPFPGRNHAEL
jgi:hypothetical protein